MSTIVTSQWRTGSDHFEPEAALNPAETRALRGHLEQIDYAAYAANRETIGKVIGKTDLETFERLAVAAGKARAEWVQAAMSLSEKPHTPSSEETARLAQLRGAFEELSQAYEALRRMVERGYVRYLRKP